MVALVLKLAWIRRKIASGSKGGGEQGIWGEKSAERNSLCTTLCQGGLCAGGARVGQAPQAPAGV